jgi:hypothetical protein
MFCKLLFWVSPILKIKKRPLITYIVKLQASALLSYTFPKEQNGTHSTNPSSTFTEFSTQDVQSLLEGPEHPPEHWT